MEALEMELIKNL